MILVAAVVILRTVLPDLSTSRLPWRDLATTLLFALTLCALMGRSWSVPPRARSDLA